MVNPDAVNEAWLEGSADPLSRLLQASGGVLYVYSIEFFFFNLNCSNVYLGGVFYVYLV